MLSIRFTLKQHTPIIHFQHEQNGATLRASEVKPKLDKFIIEQLTGKRGQDALDFFAAEKQYNQWLVGNGVHPALDYKLQINGKTSIISPIGYPRMAKGSVEWSGQFPCYFGDMGDEANAKQFSFSADPVYCTIVSRNYAFLEMLREQKGWLNSFFLKNNFGTRQSKGFGSFTLTEFDEQPVPLTNVMTTPSFVLPPQEETRQFRDASAIMQHNGYPEKLDKLWLFDQYNLFNAIDLFYRTLRSGINIPGKDNTTKLYFKSLMFFYAKEQMKPAQQWDKKTIRLHFYSDHPEFRRVRLKREDTTAKDPFNYTPSIQPTHKLDLRDLLGFSSDQNWKSYKDTISKKFLLHEGDTDSYSRFQSPVIFKPVLQDNDDFRVYILTNPLPQEYLHAGVSVDSKSFGKTKGKLSLKFPDTFSPKDYINWAIKFYNANVDGNDNPFVDYTDKSNKPYELGIIDKIYKQLNKSVS